MSCPNPMTTAKVAVVVPVYRASLAANEALALQHIVHYLPALPKYFICPEDLALESNNFTILKFPAPYFRNIAGYNDLMLSPDFYAAFSNYEYILIAQLDTLILSSNLEDFTTGAWDYIGAPWFADQDDPSAGFLGGGNGGLSLRKVAAFQSVLKKQRLSAAKIARLLLNSFTRPLHDLTVDRPLIRVLKTVNLVRKILQHGDQFIQQFDWNEDLFWSYRASIFDEQFQLAPVKISLKFSFEMHPRFCWQANQQQLPFGCHAWEKYDPAFWQPYLLLNHPQRIEELISFPHLSAINR